jgi:hypothetical protein
LKINTFTAQNFSVKAHIELRESKDKKNSDGYFSFRSRSTVELLGVKLSINQTENGKAESVEMNGEPFPIPNNLTLSGGKFFPHFDFSQKVDSASSAIRYRNVSPDFIRSICLGRLSAHLRLCLHHRVTAETCNDMAENLRPGDESSIYNQIAAHYTISDKRDEAYWRQLKELVIVNLSASLFDLAEIAVLSFSRKVEYMGPARAKAQRYYRRQELAIDDVDHTGENIPMILNGLDEQEFARLTAFCQEYFGFLLDRSLTGGHVSIMIKESETDSPINISDLGFGYSQVLPVIVQAWSAKERGSQRNAQWWYKRRTIVIEQPELHLHPKLQARLADMFAGLINSGLPVNLIIETHSEPLINRIGFLISQKLLKPEQSCINIVSKNSSDQTSSIRVSDFDSEGNLINWPYGFFAGT